MNARQRLWMLALVALACGIMWLWTRGQRGVSVSKRVPDSNFMVASPEAEAVPTGSTGAVALVTGESNSLPAEAGATVEYRSVGLDPFSSTRMNNSEYAAFVRAEEARVQEVVSRDFADGINAEARKKQARLKEQSKSLRQGLTIPDVLKTLGAPDTIRVVVTNGEAVSMRDVHVASPADAPPQAIFGYWPRVGVPFNGKNGQGYQVLYLVLNSDRRLAFWQWERPVVIYAGTINGIRRQKEYWEGVHELSPPPP